MGGIDDHIWRLILRLNSKDVLPVYGLRRNSTHYHLITAINHSIGLLISGSYGNIAVLLNRAYKELEVRDFVETDYITTCKEYLASLTTYLVENKLLTYEEQELLRGRI
ncbi:hypothetical protein [Paenibacillus sp. MABNR03]|uniref:hypothetical protein n=1 Tax=Paenibacillus sp. MABNR03 TaxID=3142626 RepID=UPI003D2AB6F4